jgi:protein disulfide-isomerase A1
LASSTEDPAPVFSATANKHRDDYLFGLTTDQDAIAAASAKAPSIFVYRSFDTPVTEFPLPVRDATAKELEDWLAELSIPIIDEVNAENYAVYAQSGKPLAYLFLDPTDDKKEEYIREIKSIASKQKGKINFVWIDGVKFGDHAKALNLAEPKWPSFVIQDVAKQLKYPLDQETAVTAESVSKFVEKFNAGELEPQLKSEPIPTSQDENVFHLVGKQFDEIVLDESKDVFLELYASW